MEEYLHDLQEIIVNSLETCQAIRMVCEQRRAILTQQHDQLQRTQQNMRQLDLMRSERSAVWQQIRDELQQKQQLCRQRQQERQWLAPF